MDEQFLTIMIANSGNIHMLHVMVFLGLSMILRI